MDFIKIEVPKDEKKEYKELIKKYIKEHKKK